MTTTVQISIGSEDPQTLEMDDVDLNRLRVILHRSEQKSQGVDVDRGSPTTPPPNRPTNR